MKKVFLILATIVTISLVGCYSNEQNEENNTNVESNTSSGNTVTTQQVSQKTNEEKIREAFGRYIDNNMTGESGDGIIEYRIEEINVLPDEEKNEIIENFSGDYFDTDVLATIIYSVKPKNIDSFYWLASNGEISGDWIVNKSFVVTLRNGELTNVGTGW